MAYVWWYDNEGVIQSHGINFVQDLPHFLVLLICFKHFTSKEWGVIPTFRFIKHNAGHCLLSFLPSLSLSTVDVAINCIDKRYHFGIVTRATRVLPANSQLKDPRDAGKSLKGMELVAKLYWPKASRIGEGEVIEKAHQIAEKNKDVDRHIPDLICSDCSHDFDEYSTKRIRNALGITTEGHCLFRVMLFRRLYPITDLTGEKFWKAFWECFNCKCTSTLCSNVLMLL